MKDLALAEGERLIVAIGDLHGDYYRLVRILKEAEVIDEDLNWQQEANTIDVVILGDYVDWRGEPLEGPPEEWLAGARKIIQFLSSLKKQIKALKQKDTHFNSEIYLLIGNHDQMMLDGYYAIMKMTEKEIKNLLGALNSYEYVLSKKFSTDKEKIKLALKFLNWYHQGGEETIGSFGSFEEWKKEMGSELGDFLRKELRVGVVLGPWLFAHTLPDNPNYWQPIEEIETLLKEDRDKVVEAFTWGRRIWGYDVLTSSPTYPFSPQLVNYMLNQMNVKGAVIGHTPVTGDDIAYAYDGKIINIDLHGQPGTKPWVEKYTASEKAGEN